MITCLCLIWFQLNVSMKLNSNHSAMRHILTGWLSMLSVTACMFGEIVSNILFWMIISVFIKINRFVSKIYLVLTSTIPIEDWWLLPWDTLHLPGANPFHSLLKEATYRYVILLYLPEIEIPCQCCCCCFIIIDFSMRFKDDERLESVWKSK